MDNRAEVREFLMSRRAKLTPEAAGIPRRAEPAGAGLRRSEVAALAGVSVEYYAKLERGAIAGASASVLDAISRALQLDDTERAHLLDLARAADGIPSPGGPPAARPQPARAAAEPAVGPGRRSPTASRSSATSTRTSLATNALGRAFYSPLIGDGGRTPNLARFQFLDPASREFYPDWDLFAEMCVAIMRAEAGRDPHDKGLQDLVGELSTRSETSARCGPRTTCAPTAPARSGSTTRSSASSPSRTRSSRSPPSPGRCCSIYTAEPGSPSAERLRLLASWAAEHPVAAIER